MCDNDTAMPDCMEEEDEGGDEPMMERKIIVGFQIAFAVLGLIGNGLMLVLMQRKRFRGQSYAVYFSFAAVFDTTNVLLHCVLDTSEVLHDTFQIGVIASNNGCKAFHFFESFFGLSSPWLMVVLTFDRLLAIRFAKKTWVQKFCRWKTAIFVSIGVLVAMVIVSIPMTVFTDSVQDPYDCVVPEHHELGGLFAYMTIHRFIPIILLTAMNMILAWALITGTTTATQLSDQMKSIRRFNIVIFYVLVMTLVTWIPLTVVELIEVATDLEDAWTEEFRNTIDKAWHATLVIYLLTFVQNFYIFILTSASYRYELAKLFGLQRFVKNPYEVMSTDQATGKTDQGSMNMASSFDQIGRV